MSAFAFLGAAGTGKTWSLIDKLEKEVAQRPIGDGQRLLALTRMHGSRLRLMERLARTSMRDRFDCMTFERLSWGISARWRSKARELGRLPSTELDFDGVCAAAAAALLDDSVLQWVHRTYPIVLVDELQDCHDTRLEIVQRLARHGRLLMAADEFQDLRAAGPSEAVAWMRQVACVEELTIPRRTKDGGLLAAAAALRAGHRIEEGASVKIFRAANANVAASFVTKGIAWSAGDEIVVISATKGDNRFVGDVLARVANKPFPNKDKSKKGYGPYQIPWEQSDTDLEADLCAGLDLPAGDSDIVVSPSFSGSTRLRGRRELEQWFEAQRRLCGQHSFRCDEIRRQVRLCVQRIRGQPRTARGVRAMTIHQAKNREFDRVLILWPVALGGSEEGKRRLLYNAVTRARKAATVIVQDPNPTASRLAVSPFFLGQ